MLANAALLDSELLARAPANRMWRCDMLRGLLGWLLRRGTRVVAVVAIDLAEVVRRMRASRAVQPPPAGESSELSDWPALPADALDAALRDYRVPRRRTFIGVCSPSGFTDEAVELARQRAEALSARGGGLVLVRPGAGGGWVVQSLAPGRREESAPARPWHFIFDPEEDDDKRDRVRSAVAAAGVELIERGLSGRELAGRLEVPVSLVREVFEDKAARQADLRVRQFDGDYVLLGRAGFASDAQARTTSMFQKLRELLGLGGQEKKKIEVLADKRALLTSRRDPLYREMDELADRERSLKQQGVASDSSVTRRRLASELAQVRRRIEEGNSLAGLLSRQIDVLSTHIHHLTMISQGQAVQMPDVEEMTRDAVRAEELIEQVKTDAEVLESLAEATGTPLNSRQEEDILAEFAEARKQAPPPEAAPPESGPAAPEQAADQPEKRRDQPMRE